MGDTYLCPLIRHGSGLLLQATAVDSHQALRSPEVVELVTFATGLHYPVTQFAYDDGLKPIPLLWVCCPRGSDRNEFAEKMRVLMAHFGIATHAFVEINDEDVCVRLTHPEHPKTWWSAGGIVTPEWERNLWTKLLGVKRPLRYIRLASEDEMVHEPQTNFARLAKQLTFKRLLTELNVDAKTV